MSSPYVVLENRPLDQWKVTELKEELKKRKLMTKGLKDDLVKRLDEAIRAELEEANQTHDNGVSDIDQPDDATLEPVVSEKTTSSMDDTSAKNESLEKDNMTEKLDINESLEKDNITENLNDENRDKVHDLQPLDHGTISVETRVIVNEVMVSEEVNKIDGQTEDDESKPELASPYEANQVKSDSISIDTISVTEKIELKDNVIGDDVKLEPDVKPEISCGKAVCDDGKTESVVVDDPVTAEEKDVGDVGSPEKLNLDGDDSMEEEGLEGKQVDSIAEITEAHVVKEVEPVDVMVEDTPAANIAECTKDESEPAVGSIKRKLHDQEPATNSNEVKRQRRWNSQQQTANASVPISPKDAFQASMKHRFLKSDSSVNHEEPKERVVPPSSKPPTNSLRIDRFLRPFTLKAVQQLLGKTGTVVSFWMDHIKTHCYVTYSSVEEAVETRNAVYNLQWPANGGRLLIAEFVDPSEVKSRTEAPLPSPVTPQPPPAATKPPPPTPQQPQQQLQLKLPPPPPLPLPPPPPLRQAALPLPPPPPLPENLEPPPVVTLDDLFRKTRATPRIYYLPLSEEQVAEKLKRNAKQ